MRIQILEEPLLEFGYGGTHQEQRAGLALYGPADVEMEGRCDAIRLGLIGEALALQELGDYLRACTAGVDAKETDLTELFPEFPGCTKTKGFHARLAFSKPGTLTLGRTELKPIKEAESDDAKIRAAVEVCAAEIRRVAASARVDVVMVARPRGIPDGVGEGIGANFHDLLKASVIDLALPIQIIRPATWRGGASVEDAATRAWNLFTALFYKSGGKPWRLHTDRTQPTRCFVGISFTRLSEGGDLFASVAQVFNELGDGVIVRGEIAEQGEHDRQPHLAGEDAAALLHDVLEKYREVHGNLPATLTVHKTSSFSDDEQRGFLDAADAVPLKCELIWLSGSENAMLIRGTKTYPPLRGTLLTLGEDEHVLYTHGSVPFYKTYPGLYVPRPLGIRPRAVERPVEAIATEILALTKLNWNRARMEARWPITLLTARRVGEILRHVPPSVEAAPQYANYM